MSTEDKREDLGESQDSTEQGTATPAEAGADTDTAIEDAVIVEDTAEEEVAEEPAAPEAPAVEEKHIHHGGVFSTVFGGALAAVVGFGAAQFLDVKWLTMAGFNERPNRVAEAMHSQAAEIEALQAKLAEVQAAATDTSVVEAGLDATSTALTDQFAALAEEFAALNAEISAGLANVTTRLETVEGEMVSANNQVAELATGVADGLSALTGGLDGVSAELGNVKESLAGVDERLVAVEKRPLVESSETAKAAFAQYEREVETLRNTIAQQQETLASTEESVNLMEATARAQMQAVREEAEAQMAEVQRLTQEELEKARLDAEKRQAEAEERAAAAQAQAVSDAEAAAAAAAFSQLEADLNAGRSFAGTLPAIGEVADLPEVLTANAEAGIPTLEQLQRSFDPLARDALQASLRTTMTEEPSNRLVAFLRTQTGLRSIEAAEGDDPDAVLSRAQTAVDAGDLAAATAELSALPEAGQSILADWAADANARVAVADAMAALAGSLNTN
ncbi:MAG: hypothetical protein ACPGNV_10385 [Mangrovicoccus sp.]